MTRDRDIEHVLDSWLSEGPTQMPSHMFEAVVDRISHVPQRRLARLNTRLFDVHFNFRLAVAAVILVVASAAGGALLAGRVTGVGGAPSPMDMAALQSLWTSKTPRSQASSGSPTNSGKALFDMLIGPEDIVINNFWGDIFSTYSPVGKDSLRLVLLNTAKYWNCQPGDEGTYTFSLSADGATLTLMAVNDECATQEGILSGEWARSACPKGLLGCSGDLAAGSHASHWFVPFETDNGQVQQGKFSYTVPVGWTLVDENFGAYTLAKTDAPANAIRLMSNAVPHSQDSTCPPSQARGVGRTTAAIESWLTTLPGLVTTEPTPFSVGGLNGVTLDLSMAPGWTHACSFAPDTPVVNTITESPASGLNVHVNVAGAARARYMLLDLGDGRALLIDVEAPDQASWDEVIAEAMQIVNSFQFIR